MTDDQSPKVDVVALARLASLDVTADELAALQKEVPTILGFVAQVADVAAETDQRSSAQRNIMRDDVIEHEGNAYTEKLLEQAAERSGRLVKVPQVIKKKK